jgi:hypothetical protein
MSQIRCRDCRYLMTWAEQRKQYGRLMRRGVDNIKAAQPRCQKCMTKYLRTHGPTKNDLHPQNRDPR